jgi:hypothetical protein
MNHTENAPMYAPKRSHAWLALAALGFLMACGEPTAPATPAVKSAPAVQAPNASLSSVITGVTNGLFTVTNGVGTLLGDLLPCVVTTEQWNTATIGPAGGKLDVGPHTLVIPRGALSKQTQITGHAVRGTKVSVEFEPSGLQFAQPTTLRMSYGVCKVPGKPVKVVYMQGDKITETEPSQDYPKSKWVEGQIRHFSSYAVAY